MGLLMMRVPRAMANPGITATTARVRYLVKLAYAAE
jgi:hypothetical protein